MVTKEQALSADRFEHVDLKNADGTRVRARRNGKTKNWVTRPAEFRIPCKHGLYEYFYITDQNADEWEVA